MRSLRRTRVRYSFFFFFLFPFLLFFFSLLVVTKIKKCVYVSGQGWGVMGTRCTRGVSVFLCLYFLCIALRNIPQMDVSFCNLFSSLKKRHNCVCVFFFLFLLSLFLVFLVQGKVYRRSCTGEQRMEDGCILSRCACARVPLVLWPVDEETMLKEAFFFLSSSNLVFPSFISFSFYFILFLFFKYVYVI